MTPARNLQLFPEKAPRQRRKAGTYSTTDNAVVAYQKTHGTADTRILTALSERANMKYLPPLTGPGLQEATGLGERAVQKGLKILVTAGLCHQVGRAWFLGPAPKPNTRANGRANDQANDRSGKFRRFAVQGGLSLRLKEWEGMGRKNNTITDSSEAAGRAVGRAVNTTQDTGTEGQAPGGAVPGGTQPATPSQDQVNNDHQDGGNDNVTGSEQVPPGPAVTPAAAQRVIREAGLSESWRSWVRLTAIRPVTQEVQSVIWATWIQQGHAALLAEQVAHIVLAGIYGNPMAGLTKRMRDGMTPVTQASTAPNRPSFTAGQRVRYPDGSVATVLAVLSRGIATDHPEYPDVPLAQIRGLQVVE